MVETMDLFTVRKQAILKEVTLLHSEPGIELLASYVNFMVRNGHNESGYPGNYCTRGWSPERVTASTLVKDVVLNRRDQIAITVLTRANQQGDLSFSGLRIVYEQGGRLFQQTSKSASMLAHTRHRVEDLPAEGRCNPDRPDKWFAPDRVGA